MSIDAEIKRTPHPDCTAPHAEEVTAEDNLNITYNLSPMLKMAGFAGWSSMEGEPAREVGQHILDVLDFMARDPQRWRAMNPENGWGKYDECIQGRMRAWAQRCRDAGPQDRVRIF